MKKTLIAGLLGVACLAASPMSMAQGNHQRGGSGQHWNNTPHTNSHPNYNYNRGPRVTNNYYRGGYYRGGRYFPYAAAGVVIGAGLLDYDYYNYNYYNVPPPVVVYQNDTYTSCTYYPDGSSYCY